MRFGCISFHSYIKPQLYSVYVCLPVGCISFHSYIKPQHYLLFLHHFQVVYRSIPTSNRNQVWKDYLVRVVVYRSIPTSNRNSEPPRIIAPSVVYRSIPTSNRNPLPVVVVLLLLYIVPFLHQTATECSLRRQGTGCISFHSYIKPQRLLRHCQYWLSCISFHSYIKPQPHWY